MDVFEAIKSRRSIRVFEKNEVKEEKLARVLEAGRLAPSARNMQEWRFVVVRNKALRGKLAEAAQNQYFVAQAPVVIVGCGTITDYVMSCGQLSYPIDVAIAMTQMTLQAVEEGLGTCWVGAFDEAAVKEVLDIPPAIRVVELMPLGYPADQPKPKQRLALDEIVFPEKWGQ